MHTSACLFSRLGLSIVLAAAPAAVAAKATAVQSFDIPAGPLASALLAYAHQSHQQLIYDAAAAGDQAAPALRGRFTPEAALQRLLAGSRLTATQTRPGVLVLKPKSLSGPNGPSAAGRAAPSAEPVSESSISAQTGLATPVTAGPVASPLETPAQLSEVVVTGSLIRGRRASPSAMLSISRESLDRSGYATVADMLANLPQSFGGVASPEASLTRTDGLGTNDAMAKGVNLRGLGASATLVLVNGRRLAGSGLKGDFADVSAIPTAAVDHIEILLDGASALYGSDAVGGVVNIILRDAFEGAESRARYGVAAGGRAEQVQLSHSVGRTWSGGHALLSYEYQHDDPLMSSDRRYTATTDLRALGGSDHRQIYSHPGNILSYDSTAGAYVAKYAVPTGQDGTALTPADFLAGTQNLQDFRLGSEIIPRQERNSVYFDLGQALTDRITLKADALYTRRSFDAAAPASVTIFSVSDANPHYVSPDGSTSELIGYSFADELGPIHSLGVSQNYGGTLDVTVDLPRTWRLDVYGAFAEEKDRQKTRNELNSGYLNEALGDVPDDPATRYSAARDGYFNPFGDGGANSQTILDFVGSGYERSWTTSTTASVNATADGTLFTLPGGPLKAAIGLNLRRERFTPRARTLLSGAVPTQTGGQTYARSILAGFGELRIPLVGPGDALPGVQRLEASVAGRFEHYDDVGSTANPKIGLLWSPTSSLNLRSTYGTSFRAPSLTDVYGLQAISPALLESGASENLVLIRYGGDRDLKPEKAVSWTAGADFSPRKVPGLNLNATWFDIRFKNQIGTPALENLGEALTNPDLASFVTRVSPGTNAADLALIKGLIDASTSPSIGLYPPSAFSAVIDARSVNAAQVHVQGVDFGGSYHFEAGGSRFDLAANATYLMDYRRKLTATADAVQLVDTAGEPVDLRAQASLNWTRAEWGAGLTINYVDDYKTTGGVKVDAWTTADLQLRWRSGVASGPLAGLLVALTAQNLFNSHPPFYDSPQGVGYDPANASALGRFVSVELTKHW